MNGYRKIISPLFWVIWMLWPYASIWAQEKEIRVNEYFQDVSLYVALDKIKREYQLEMYIDPDLVKDFYIPKIRINRRPLDEALKLLLEDTAVDFTIESPRTVKLFKRIDSPPQTSPNSLPERFNFNLSGVIRDSENGETLPHATIRILGTNQGVLTNIDGYFTLLNVPSDTATLEVSYLGYQTATYRLSPQTNLDFVSIELTPTAYELGEVVIAAENDRMVQSKGISHISVSPTQIAALPSLGEKDIFRSLQLLPGVNGTNETTSGLYVRGGTPDQNLILFDGFTVYHIDHFYGFFSAFNAEAIKDIQLYKGGFEAKYGGRLSSVVEMTGKSGNRKEFDLGVGISALSANLRLEAPLGEKITFFLAGRRSYTDIIKSGLFNKINDLVGPSTAPERLNNLPNSGRRRRFGTNEVQPSFYFYDLNAKLSFTPGDKDVLSLSFYNGEDHLDNSFDNNVSGFGANQGGSLVSETVDITQWGNWGVSGKWARQWSDRLYSNAVLAYSNYFSQRDQSRESQVELDTVINIRTGLKEDNDVSNISLRIDNEYQLSQESQLEFGLEINRQSVDYFFSRNDTLTLINRQDEGNLYAGYIQHTWNPIDKFTLNAGVRGTYYDITQEYYWEPRASMSYQLTDHIGLKMAWGQYYQYVNRVVREDVLQGSRDFWLLSDGEILPVGYSAHYIAGFSYERAHFLLDVEGYYKELDGLSEYTTRLSQNRRGLNFEDLIFNGSGISKGVEVLLQKKTGDHTGWISYTLSEVLYDFPAFGDEPFPALQDQTHELKIVNTLNLGRWTFGGTWVYSTGKPYTAPSGAYQITLLDGTTLDYVSVGAKNAFRLPDYHRMDLSATYEFPIGSADSSMGLSIFNVYGRKNIWYKEFEIVEGELIETNIQLLGFTPNFFFNIDF